MAAVGNLNPQAVGARFNGSTVTLRRAEVGFVSGGPGTPYPLTIPASSTAVVIASEGNTIPRWPTTPHGSARVEYRYKLQITLPETYAVVSDRGAPISTERKGGLIPHSNLSSTKNGRNPRPAANWIPGDLGYLITRHIYVESGGKSEPIEPGECIKICSGPRTKTSLLNTTDPRMAYYAFQRTNESRANKEWISADKIHEAYLL